MNVPASKKRKIYDLTDEGFSDWEISKIVGLPINRVGFYMLKYYAKNKYSLNRNEINNTLFDELLDAFKLHCNIFSLNKKEVRTLIDRCETYKKIR